MRVLSLDTSTMHTSVALLVQAGQTWTVLSSRDEGPPRKQSEMLPGILDDVLRAGGKSLDDVEALALGMGPGSFTGLRVGLATFKAIAFARKLRIGRCSSLAALALGGPADTVLYPCALARQGELYVGAYRRTGDGVALLEPEDVDTPTTLAEKLKRDPSARVLGPGLESTAAALREAGVAPEQILAEHRFATAVSVAALAEFPEAFDAQALFALEPHYLRASEPERNPKFPPLPGPTPTARIRGE